MFDDSHFDGHEQTIFASDEESGLKAIIAIHSTALGPSAGGCRLWHYKNSSVALNDALRLSWGMSYKNAMAGLPFGGGKSVILGPVAPERRELAFQAFGRIIHSLKGRYVTAEDVGVDVSDMAVVQTQTPYVSGVGGRKENSGGDPSPYTARGVRRAMEAMILVHEQRDSLEGLKIAVQGAGHVGYHLCRELHLRGAKLLVADIEKKNVQRVCDEFGAESCDTDRIFIQDTDIFAPCALGGVLTAEVARSIRARYVTGAANNQLSGDEAGQILFERSIAYAPDYVANAGGIISVAAEYLGDKSEEDVLNQVDDIFGRMAEIQEQSVQGQISAHLIANKIAREKIALGRSSKAE